MVCLHTYRTHLSYIRALHMPSHSISHRISISSHLYLIASLSYRISYLIASHIALLYMCALHSEPTYFPYIRGLRELAAEVCLGLACPHSPPVSIPRATMTVRPSSWCSALAAVRRSAPGRDAQPHRTCLSPRTRPCRALAPCAWRLRHPSVGTPPLVHCRSSPSPIPSCCTRALSVREKESSVELRSKRMVARTNRCKQSTSHCQRKTRSSTNAGTVCSSVVPA